MNLLQIFIKSDFGEHFHLGMQQCWKRWWDGHLFMFFQRNWFRDIFLMGTKTTNFRTQFTKQHTSDIAFNENIIVRPWYTPKISEEQRNKHLRDDVSLFGKQFYPIPKLEVSSSIFWLRTRFIWKWKKRFNWDANLDGIKEKIRFINGHVLSCVFST